MVTRCDEIEGGGSAGQLSKLLVSPLFDFFEIESQDLLEHSQFSWGQPAAAEGKVVVWLGNPTAGAWVP